MPDPPTLSIIIVTYNAGAFLPDCLWSLSRRPPSFGIEVIVVDNASTDDSVALARRHYPAAQVIAKSENAGFAAANNIGYRRSSGEFILLLNPDTIVHEGALDRMANFLREHPDAGAAGPRILSRDGSLQRTGVSAPSLWNQFVETVFLDRAFPRSRMFGRHRRLYDDPDRCREVDCLQGSCLLLRREAIRHMLFDESYFLYFEETDLCARLKADGWKVFYAPDASVVHIGGSGARYYDCPRIVAFHRGYLVYLQKHCGPLQRPCFRALLVVRAVLRLALLSLGALAIRNKRPELFDRAKGYFRTLSYLTGLTR